MSQFIYVESQFLKEIAAGNPNTPSLYYHRNRVLRYAFWQRLRTIKRLIDKQLPGGGSCLDFGGGSGVFLPTLSGCFASVTEVDLDTRDAEKVVKKHRLSNVVLVQQDVANADLKAGGYDAIVAADVLEHFRTLSTPVRALKRLLSPQGVLFTSLPTENWIYIYLRRIFKVEKPHDHYHTATEVEHYLRAQGFYEVCGYRAPCGVPLFSVKAWRLAKATSKDSQHVAA